MAARLFALARAAVVSVVFVSLWTWFAPRWIAFDRHVAVAPKLTLPAAILMAIGAAIMLRCIWDFAWTGRGTPAPFDPPRALVVRGLYRWVRNPMYVGMGIFLTGEALALEPITRQMLILIAVLWATVTLFILIYEEPTLRRLFGDDYRDYCRHVRRWLPRLTPFDKTRAAAAGSPHLE